MSIDKEYGKYIPVCDGCGKILEPTQNFSNALKAMENDGWSRRIEGNDWKNYCPACEEE